MAILLPMGRRGYLSTLGASASLAAAGSFAVFLVAAAIAFNGWPGVDDSAVANRTVTLGSAAPGPSVGTVVLRSARDARGRERARMARTARGGPRQRVKGVRGEGSSNTAKAAATPHVSVEPDGVATVAPEQTLQQPVDDLQESVKETLPEVSEAVDPLIDEVQDAAGGTSDAVGQLSGQQNY